MPALPLSDLGARAGALLRRWKADAAGLAAIEFAFIAPMMGVMFIGSVELSQAIIVDRRVTQIASTTADLVARAETQIAQSDITDIMKAGSFIMAPYNQNPLQIVMRDSSLLGQRGTVKQSWSCTYNGTGSTLTCGCSNTATAPRTHDHQ
jgi:Flp pilus assembly protein TadG